MLHSGDTAPLFTLPDADMQKVALEDFYGTKNVVLYFYPKDGTSAAIQEALDFTELSDEFAAYDTVVLGVSKDTCMSHALFRDKHGFSIQLLADPDGEVCERYGVWQEVEKSGVKSTGILPSTFILDRQGIVRHVFYGVKAHGHAAHVLELIIEMKKSSL